MFFIGIAGGSGSGKTTFAEKIVKLAGTQDLLLLHQDSYYLSPQPKENFFKSQPNFDHPNAFDWPLLRGQLRDLKEGKPIACPSYDYKVSQRRPETLALGPCKVCILDGIYALWDEEIRDMMQLKIFINVDADIRFIRRLHRDVRERGRTLDNVISQYYDTVRPMHRQYLQPTSQFADLMVGEETDIPAQVIAFRIRAVLSQEKGEP